MRDFIRYLLDYKKNTERLLVLEFRLRRCHAIGNLPRDSASHSCLAGRLIAVRIIAEGEADD
ncbi:hypothetical protein NVP1077O_41 [Vibrio phage 1.077.O._10N.261.45.A10]|nr:hypothetical protein NVP1070O_41 [Vibrio phage 1.070.O._10N.261.45.B2]AUR85619.1 hypothetical protein NVP1077O_41 [Vibrio phage 1.077.O._10N.261.45.A10]